MTEQADTPAETGYRPQGASPEAAPGATRPSPERDRDRASQAGSHASDSASAPRGGPRPDRPAAPLAGSDAMPPSRPADRPAAVRSRPADVDSPFDLDFAVGPEPVHSAPSLPPNRPASATGPAVVADERPAGRAPTADVDKRAASDAGRRPAADVDNAPPSARTALPLDVDKRSRPAADRSASVRADVDKDASRERESAGAAGKPLFGKSRVLRGLPAPSVVVEEPEGDRLFLEDMPAFDVETGEPRPSAERLDDVRRIIAGELRRKNEQREREAGEVERTAHGTSRSPSTQAQYRRRGQQLRKRYLRETGTSPASATAVDFATWFVSLRADYKASSWRYQRQTAKVALELFAGDDDVARAAMIIESDPEWDSEIDGRMNGRAKQRAEGRSAKSVTSENRAKNFPYDAFARIEAELRVNRLSDRTAILIDWLRAGIATGLRPVEWKATDIRHVVEPRSGRHRVYLFVLNAKHTNGRGNGILRTLDITEFTETTLSSVRTMSDRGAEWFMTGEFDDVQSQCAQHLYRLCEKFWPRRATRYGLYSTRHQFVLNMRELAMDEAEISALMGHLVTETQMSTYGRKSRGWSIDRILDRPKAIQEEIGSVRRTLDYAKQRRKLRALAAGRAAQAEPVEEYAGPEHP
jgi:hypothetical protein